MLKGDTNEKAVVLGKHHNSYEPFKLRKELKLRKNTMKILIAFKFMHETLYICRSREGQYQCWRYDTSLVYALHVKGLKLVWHNTSHDQTHKINLTFSFFCVEKN